MTSVSEKLAELRNPTPTEKTSREWALELLPLLPGNMPAPIIANGSETNRVTAWLSFHNGYDESRPGSWFLAQLESAGFTTSQATLARYGNYRRSPKPGAQNDLPEISSRENLTDSEPIAPVWIEPQQHGRPDAIAFYCKNGRTFRVRVPAPSSVGLWARRIEPRGTWYFERGSARLRFPEAWHAIQGPEFPVAQVAAHSGAYVDTEQGISGAIYFTPFLEPDEFPLTGAQFLAALESDQ